MSDQITTLTNENLDSVLKESTRLCWSIFGLNGAGHAK